MSMSTGQAGYASQAYRSSSDAPEPQPKRQRPRAETRAVASLGRRALTCLVDMAVLGTVGGVLGGLAGILIGFDALLTGRIALGWLLALPAIGLILMLVYIIMQATGGSLAQRWFDVRVVRAETGERVGFGRAFARHLLWVLAGVIVVGYFSPLFDASGRRQGWHDKATATLVVDVSASRAAVRDVAFAPPQDAPAPVPDATSGHEQGAPAAAATWAPSAPPAPPASDRAALAGEPVPADTPAPPIAHGAPSTHDSFAPPTVDDGVVSDDTIALPPRDRPTPHTPASSSPSSAVPRDPFAPPESPSPPASPVEPAREASPEAPAERAPVPPLPSPPAPPRDDPAVPAPPLDPMTVPVPPDDEIDDDTVVLNRRPTARAARTNALLAGDGFALMPDAGGLSIVRDAETSDIIVSRGGAALMLPVGSPVRLAPGDVLTIGDRSITVGGE